VFVTSVFSIVNASMLRPYGMDDPSTVVRITREGHHPLVGWPYTQFLRMQEGPTLARVEASDDDVAPFSVERTDEAVPRRLIRFVSGGYLQMLGGRPAVGRSLGPADDTAGAPPVIVVSHYFWRTTLGADPTVVGKFVWVNGKAVRLVGVLQPTVHRTRVHARSPVGTVCRHGRSRGRPDGDADERARRSRHGSSTARDRIVHGRCGPDSPRESAERVSSPSASGTPAIGVRLHRAGSPLDAPIDADAYVALAGAFGLTGLVLALACTNASNILLAFAATRVAEVRVRLALGATRSRLVAQLSTESLLVGAIAGGIGFVIAFWLVPIFGAVVLMPPEVNLKPDGHVLLFAVTLAFVCSLGVCHRARTVRGPRAGAHGAWGRPRGGYAWGDSLADPFVVRGPAGRRVDAAARAGRTPRSDDRASDRLE
jgi:hypothetical protein